MIGRRATVGLSLLCALAFCALAAQSASAAKAVNTTAVTCVKGGGSLDFNDSHCAEFVGAEKGAFGHEAVPVNETKSLAAVNVGNILLKATIAGLATEIECKKMVTRTNESVVHNIETEKKHTMTGNGVSDFSECEVKKPAKCVLKEPMVAEGVFEGVEGLGEGKNEMGVEFKGAGGGETFAELSFENKGAEKCGLSGPYAVKGSAIGTSKGSQSNKYTGATIVFEPGNGMENISIASKVAEVTMTITPSGSGGGGHPIPITTTT